MTQCILMLTFLLAFINKKVTLILVIISYALCIIIILFGACGFIDKNGPIEEGANEFISGHSNVPINLLKKLEGVKHE